MYGKLVINSSIVYTWSHMVFINLIHRKNV